MSELSDPRDAKFGMYRIVSIAILIVVIIATSLLFYRVMIGFFIPLFLAALLVVLFHPLHAWFDQRLKHRAKLAALLTTTTILLIVLLPGCILLGVASIQATHLLKDLNLGSIDLAFSRVLVSTGLELPMAEELEAIDESLTSLNQALSPTSSDIRIVRLEKRFAELKRGLNEKFGNQYDDAFELLAEDMLAIRDHATAMETADTSESELGIENSPVNLFHQAVSSVTRDYRQLKNDISGGPILGPLRQTINPTPIKRERWIRQSFEYFQPFAVQLTQATAVFAGKTLFGIAILTISIYFFLIDGPGMTQTIMSLSPLDDRYERELLDEFEKVSRAVVLATFLSALAQGALAMIGYYVAGLQSIALLFLLTTFMALIPFLGAASVWLPCSLWLGLVQSNWTAAIGLAIYGMLVVSMADNVIKPLVLQGQSNLHPLLALLSVIGGVQVFGPIGILVGPMIVVFLQTLLDILNRELSHFDSHVLAKGDKVVEPPDTLSAAD